MHILPLFLCCLLSFITHQNLPAATELLNYEEALKKMEKYIEGDFNKQDKIWAHRLKLHTLYLMWNEAVRNKDEKKKTLYKEKISESIKKLDAFIKQSQDDKDLKEELEKAKSMCTSIISGMAIYEKDFLAVLELYDSAFFESPELESSVMQRIVGQMCTACYYLDSERTISKDPAKFIKIWQHYARTHKILGQVKTTTGAKMIHSSKALLISAGKMHKQCVWLLNNKDQVAEFDHGTMTLIKNESLEIYNQLRDSLDLKKKSKQQPVGE